MSPKTFKKTSETVDNIIHCAAGLFRHFGYKKTTVDEIASLVHISKKTLYSIFPSKEEILSEATWRDTMDVMDAFGATVPPTAQPDTILLLFCRFIFNDRIKKGIDGVFWGINSKDPAIRSAYLNSLKRVIINIYKEGSHAGLFKPVDPVLASDLVCSLVTTALDRFYKTTQPVSMFNDVLSVIADSVMFKDRIAFDKMG